MTEKRYVNAKELAEILGCSVSHSYKIIKRLNSQLDDQGYVTMAGKVPLRYVDEKLYF